MKTGDIIEINGKKFRVGKEVAYDPSKHVINKNVVTSMDEDDVEKNFLRLLGALLHDLGKIHCQHQGMKTNKFVFDGKEIEETIQKVSEHPQTGIEPASEFCKALRMSNEEIHFICSIIAHHMEFHELQELSDEHLWRCTAHPLFKEIMLVALADERGGVKLEGFDERGSVQDIMNDKRVKDFISKGPLPKPILTGNDLIKFGKKPSPLFKKALDAAFKAQINGKLTDKGQLFRSVKNILK